MKMFSFVKDFTKCRGKFVRPQKVGQQDLASAFKLARANHFVTAYILIWKE